MVQRYEPFQGKIKPTAPPPDLHASLPLIPKTYLCPRFESLPNMRRRRKLTKRELMRRKLSTHKNKFVKMSARRTFQRPADFMLTEEMGEQSSEGKP